uniref:Uncharacterized protein n=1 Tax=Cucumis melo TaxID=3656 RepID=A0A9I9CXY8_CUCME
MYQCTVASHATKNGLCDGQRLEKKTEKCEVDGELRLGNAEHGRNNCDWSSTNGWAVKFDSEALD